jgi:hypothetical protein
MITRKSTKDQQWSTNHYTEKEVATWTPDKIIGQLGGYIFQFYHSVVLTKLTGWLITNIFDTCDNRIWSFKSTTPYIYCSELELWGKENNWLNFIFLLISPFPLEIVLEDAHRVM